MSEKVDFHFCRFYTKWEEKLVPGTSEQLVEGQHGDLNWKKFSCEIQTGRCGKCGKVFRRTV